MLYNILNLFLQNAQNALSSHGIKVNVYDKKWAEDQKMGAFLSVAKGSMEPPMFVEMIYQNGPPNQKPIVLIGKENKAFINTCTNCMINLKNKVILTCMLVVMAYWQLRPCNLFIY